MAVCQDGGIGRAREVAAVDELHGQELTLAYQGDVRVGHLDQVVLHHVPGLLEPEGRQPVQHLALEREGSDHHVEAAHAVGDDDGAAPVRAVVVAYLALVALAESGEVRPIQSSGAELLE